MKNFNASTENASDQKSAANEILGSQVIVDPAQDNKNQSSANRSTQEPPLESKEAGFSLANYKERALKIMFAAMFVSVLVGLGIYWDSDFRNPIMCIIGVVSVGLGLSLTKRVNLASLLIAAIFLAVPPYFATSSLGVYNPTMLLIPVGMFVVMLVSSSVVVTWIYCAFAFLSGLAIFYATIWGSATARMKELTPLNMFSDSVLSVVIVTISMLATGLAGVLLAKLLKNFQESKDDLEEKVNVRTKELKDANEELSEALHLLSHASDEAMRSERLVSLGSMVAGVAHELNTPLGNAKLSLSSLAGNVDTFKKQLQEKGLSKSALIKFLDDTKAAALLAERSNDRAAELVASFKRVAVDQSAQWRREFNLHEVVEDILKTIAPTVKHQPWVLRNSVPFDIQMDSYPGPVGQLVSNLVQNAIVHALTPEQSHVVDVFAFVTGNEVVISVSDNGVGMSEEVLKRIFDPFYTTRMGQGGSGLGLTVCFNLVNTVLGGELRAESVHGAGSTFTAKIPLYAPLKD